MSDRRASVFGVNAKVAVSVLVAVLLGVAASAYAFWLKPRMELGRLAEDACRQMDGAIILQVGPILTSATSRAAELGFEKSDLMNEMKEKCPDTMAGLQRWAEQHRQKAGN